MIVAGIDPGKTGALVLADSRGIVSCYEVPLLAKAPDFTRWGKDWSVALAGADHIFIEAVHALPGQGVSSMFNFGYSAGFVYGLVVASGKPHTFITPQAWKRRAGLSGSDGEDSRRRASELFPEAVDFWKRKKDHGMAEAALIAWVGRQILEGKNP